MSGLIESRPGILQKQDITIGNDKDVVVMVIHGQCTLHLPSDVAQTLAHHMLRNVAIVEDRKRALDSKIQTL